jgi:hypothetical protein
VLDVGCGLGGTGRYLAGTIRRPFARPVPWLFRLPTVTSMSCGRNMCR